MHPLDAQLLNALREWTADHRIETAAEQRSAIRWQRQLATEELRFVDVLHNARLHNARSSADTTLLVSTRRMHRGTIAAVGSDFCVMVTPRGTALVCISAISSVQLDAKWTLIAPPSTSHERAHERSHGPSIGEALSLIVEQRPAVQITTRSGDGHSGELVAVGDDVVILDQPGEAGRTLVVPIDAIADLIL